MRAFLIAAIIFSPSVFACPDLAGEFSVCRSTINQVETSKDVVISQKVQNRVMTYTMTKTDGYTGEKETETYKADGKVRIESFRDPDTGMTLENRTSVRCTGSVLTITTQVRLNGMVFGSSDVKLSKNGSDLIIESHYSNADEESTDVEICR